MSPSKGRLFLKKKDFELMKVRLLPDQMCVIETNYLFLFDPISFIVKVRHILNLSFLLIEKSKDMYLLPPNFALITIATPIGIFF